MQHQRHAAFTDLLLDATVTLRSLTPVYNGNFLLAACSSLSQSAAAWKTKCFCAMASRHLVVGESHDLLTSL